MTRLFQDLLLERAFAYLNCFTMIQINNPELLAVSLVQLATSASIIKAKCLWTMVAVESQMEIGGLLPLLLAIDAGIRTIDLSGNLFVRPIVREGPISFWSMSNFCFANCEFTSESLLSLFKAFATGSGVPFRVDISGLKIADGSLSGFFEGLSVLSIPRLVGLHWNNCGFSESDQRRFVEFVCRNVGLRELSLIDSIRPRCLSLREGLAEVGRPIRRRIVARVAPPGPREYRRTLLRFMQNNGIEFIDISGQPIDEHVIIIYFRKGICFSLSESRQLSHLHSSRLRRISNLREIFRHRWIKDPIQGLFVRNHATDLH
jgi:hypothetical protein